MHDANEEDAWHDSWLATVYTAAETLAGLHKTNPRPDRPLLPQAMNYMMTELWDRGFSQTEIRQAFQEAIDDMNRYAAGQETRE